MTTLLDLGAVTVAGYRARTGDATTDATTVEAALNDAERLLEEELRRLLAHDTYTEMLRIQADGRMYPNAYPLTGCATNTIEGRALLGGSPDVVGFVALIGTTAFPTASVTYSGGYGSPSTALPLTLAHAIYDLGHGTVRAAQSQALVGATSMTVGDVSVTLTSGFEGQSLDTYVPGVSGRVARYKNRFVG